MPVSSSARRAKPDIAAEMAARVDWRRVAYHTLVSRALDEAEEATNRNKASVPRDHVVLYQFSARGHEMAQTILGALLEIDLQGRPAPVLRTRPSIN
jgi:2-oxoisovalerate dehydrogenase E1 component